MDDVIEAEVQQKKPVMERKRWLGKALTIMGFIGVSVATIVGIFLLGKDSFMDRLEKASLEELKSLREIIQWEGYLNTKLDDKTREDCRILLHIIDNLIRKK